MKKIVLTTFLCTLLSVLFMLLDKEMKEEINVYLMIYIVILPLVLTGTVFFIKRFDFGVIKYLGLALSMYLAFSAISEAIILKFWKVYITPAGDSYTQYGLDGVFIPLGLIVVLIIFFVALIGLAAIKFYRKTH